MRDAWVVFKYLKESKEGGDVHTAEQVMEI